jgi:hypothetical protein
MAKEIILTRGKVAIVDDEDFKYLNQYKWYASKIPKYDLWYANRTTSLKKEGFRKDIGMHRVIMNPPPKMFVDHIDHNGLNNQRSNLRIVTQRQNNQNMRRLTKEHLDELRLELKRLRHVELIASQLYQEMKNHGHIHEVQQLMRLLENALEPADLNRYIIHH